MIDYKTRYRGCRCKEAKKQFRQKRISKELLLKILSEHHYYDTTNIYRKSDRGRMDKRKS